MMYLGIDTSNYTTSTALFDGTRVIQRKKLLEVKSGQCGLRQSDAVFAHTVNLPELMQSLSSEIMGLEGVGVSVRPRTVSGSYMPCFLAGRSSAYAIGCAAGIPVYETSHQIGHILAALYSAERLDFIHERFIAFHVSGGTTEALLVTPDETEIISAQVVAQSTDLKAGQGIDRTGVMLGLPFPAGKEIDVLAQQSQRRFKIKPSMNGSDCSLSGIENKCRRMIEEGEEARDVARFAVDYVLAAVDGMTQRVLDRYGALPLVFAGGVMSNSIISKVISEKYGALFAESAYSCDNAVGVAIQAYLKDKR